MLYVICPDCQVKNLPGRSHCLGCGRDLADVQPTPEQIVAAGYSPATGAALSDTGQPLTLAESVVQWYRVYCGVLLALFLLAGLLSIASVSSRQSRSFDFPIAALGNLPDGVPDIMRKANEDFRRQEQGEVAGSIALVFLILTPLIIAVGAPFFMKPTPSAWTYHIVVICLGLGGCTLPFSIILLIHWFKPEVQAYFGRGTPAPATQ